MERTLHSILPPISASILSYHMLRVLVVYWGIDQVALLLPHVFAVFMAISMLVLGCSTSSFEDKGESVPTFSISVSSARVHSMILLMVPGLMHFLMFRQRILSLHASLGDFYELMLAWAAPYLLHCGLLLTTSNRTPYQMPNKLFPRSDENTLRGAFVPVVVSLLASFAAQQRFLIQLCNQVSYQFNGHNLPSTWVVSGFLTSATCCTLFALWTWGRKSTVTGEFLFGEYHDDVVQLTISAAGFLLAKAFGMPWNLTPLPILACLGLSVWMTSRMLRYLVIFLFVLHAGSLALFSYRYASIDINIPLAIPGMKVGLIRFGMMEIAASMLIGLFVGFASRPSGGVGTFLLKRVDVPGALLVSYVLLLTTLECTLLKRLVPEENIAQDTGVRQEDATFLYDHATALLTTVSLLAIVLLTRRQKTISNMAFVLSLSIGLGKALAFFIDASESDGKLRNESKLEHLATRLLTRVLSASLLFVVILGPSVLLSPVHLKTSARYKRSLNDGKPVGSLPARTMHYVYIYSLLIVPASLIATVPTVLSPLAVALCSHYGGGAYYKAGPPLSEMIGGALAMWGIATLAMVNSFLPDGGAETWKKAAALTLLMGIGVAFSAPTIPDWIVGTNSVGMANPYASISSLGTSLVVQGRNGTGGWGILSASMATLLAITGPLELRERRHPSGKKDQFLLFRLMVFSLLFGSGVSWFITLQSMGQEEFFVLLITVLANAVVSFFGTVTCVLGYFLELENFDEAVQITKVWTGAFLAFGLLTGIPSLFLSNSSMHAFGAGGWLTTYLTVNSIAAFSLTLALRMRKTKNQATRGLGNLSCVLAYAFAILVLYGCFGVSGMDYTLSVTLVLGAPVSIPGTFLLAPMLLGLEGESQQERRSRVSRIAATNGQTASSGMLLTLKTLRSSNRLAPLVGATCLVFFLAGFYSIFLRGSFLFGSFVVASHSDVFSKTVGLGNLAQQSISSSRTLIIAARMAGGGFWTASNPLGPLVHLGGLVATVPNTFWLVSYLWTGATVPAPQIIACLPLNLIPILFCRSIPVIPAAAVIGAVGGLFQVLNLYHSTRKSQMRI